MPRRIEAGVVAAIHAGVLLLISVPSMVVLAAEPADDVSDGVGRPRREQAVDDATDGVGRPRREQAVETSVPPTPPPFSTYRANYLIIGPENSPVAGNVTSKFQLSLKYDTGANWYFAYTQRSYWDISRESSPILDHNIEPGVFYFWRPAAGIDGRWGVTGTRAGFVHQSNGRDGANSRAWNRAYVEPLFRWREFLFEPRAWAIASRDVENRNIADYYGYADIVFGVETATRQRFTVTGRQGLKHSSLQIDLSLPANSLFKGNTMRPYLYAQLWTGYGETLLYYNLRTSAFRIGIEFHP